MPSTECLVDNSIGLDIVAFDQNLQEWGQPKYVLVVHMINLRGYSLFLPILKHLYVASGKSAHLIDSDEFLPEVTQIY